MCEQDIIKLALLLGFKDTWIGVIYKKDSYYLHIFEGVVSLYNADINSYVFFGHHITNLPEIKFNSEHYKYAYNKIKREFRYDYRKFILKKL